MLLRSRPGTGAATGAVCDECPPYQRTPVLPGSYALVPAVQWDTRAVLPPMDIAEYLVSLLVVVVPVWSE
uniref:Uncharacterized protein n=1 Tax=uncultured marine virus TaxID=186617 RepID=A0A0F7L9M1_9VIRU|nr:hypothetical protein [uncultured marine virus]